MSTHRFIPPLDTPGLSPGELNVLTLAHQGKSNAEASRALGIKSETVRMHIHHATDKYRDAQAKAALKEMKGSPDPRPNGYR